MKKTLILLATLIFSLVLVGCKPKEQGEQIDQNKIDNVINIINNLPSSLEISADSKEEIENARVLYDELKQIEKDKVTNYSKLTSAEAKLKRVLEQADEDLLEQIANKMSLLPKADQITVNERSLVDEIENLISELNFINRNQVPNILLFDIAKDQVAYLENEAILNGLAQEVIDAINTLPNIDDLTLADEEAVKAVRAKYDSLVEEARYKVTNYKVLLELEDVIKTLNEFKDFDPRDVLDCVSDILTSNSNDLIITEGENFTVKWESSNDKLLYFEDGHVKISKVYQTHRKQHVNITAKITLSNNELVTLTKLVTVEPVTFAPMPSTPVATYFQSGALSNYTNYSERYLKEGTLFSDKAKDVLDIIYYAFANLDEAGNVRLSNLDIVKELNAMKAYDTRVVLCIAGVSTEASKIFTNLTADDAKRAVLVKNIMDAVETYNFDGVDIDWESTSQAPVVAVSMNKLMRDLRKEMDARQDPNGTPYLLSAAVPASSWGAAKDRFDFATLNKYVDYINMMSYDMNKTTNATHLSPLYISSFDGGYGFGCDYGVQLFTSRGLDKNKIIIGSAGYGKSYQVSANVLSEKYPGLSASASLMYLKGIPGAHASGTLFYNAISKLLNNSQYKKYIEYNSKGQLVGSFLFNEYAKIFVTYDSEEVIEAKYEYAQASEGMGIMCWAYTEDTADNFINSIYNVKNK